MIESGKKEDWCIEIIHERRCMPLSLIERLADRMMSEAVRSHATDIHIIPRRNDTLIQFRISSKLIPKMYLPKEDCDKLISHFKFTASMDIGEEKAAKRIVRLPAQVSMDWTAVIYAPCESK